MRRRITRNDLHGVIVCVHEELGDRLAYYGGQHLGYNTGIYGWNWNATQMAEFAVVYGYRSFPRADISLNYEECINLRDRADKLPKDERFDFLVRELRARL